MVRGLDKFSSHFEAYKACYVVIGGVACDTHFEDQGLIFRATKDVDVVLVVEAIDARFIASFWEFIKEGEYEKKQVSEDGRKYYRFIRPQNEYYPMQLELFSRKPDLIPEWPDMTITPIPADEELSSLSAILMDDAYYHFTIENSRDVNGARIAESEALICLKAKAYLDLTRRKGAGELIDSKNISKHKNDVFRLAAILRGDSVVEAPDSIKNDLQDFISLIKEEKPDLKTIFRNMGIVPLEAQELLGQLQAVFRLG